MTQFLQQLVNGLSLGSIYALIALGYTMVYGIIKLINFAHGDIYMLGAFTAFYATTVFHLNFFLALIVAMVLCGVLGVLIERIAYKPLRHATRITALITAMGVSYILEYTTQYFAGSEVKTFPEDVLNNAVFQIGGIQISQQQIYIIAVTLILRFTVYKENQLMNYISSLLLGVTCLVLFYTRRFKHTKKDSTLYKAITVLLTICGVLYTVMGAVGLLILAGIL